MSQLTREEVQAQLKEIERKIAFWKKGILPKFMKDLENEVIRLKTELSKIPIARQEKK